MKLAYTRGYLPGRFRHAWDFPAQGQLPETKPANTELPQEPSRTPAELAAVMLARGKLGLPGFVLVQPDSVFHSFCCSCHSILFETLSYALKGMPMCRSNDRAWLSLAAVVTIVTFMPFNLSTFSYEISGKIS